MYALRIVEQSEQQLGRALDDDCEIQRERHAMQRA